MSWKAYKPNISNDEELLDLVCRVIKIRSATNAPSIMILGPPGIGKSERLLEAIKTCFRSLDDVNEILIYENIAGLLYQEKLKKIFDEVKNGAVIVRIAAPYVMPQDFGWYPERSKSMAYAELPPLWFSLLNEAKYGALIIEDITEVDDRYTMVLLQRLGFEGLLKTYKVNKPIFMTGNPSEFSVNDNLSINITTASGRFIVQTLSIPTLKSWKAYMDREYGSWDIDVYKFLNLTSEFGVRGIVEKCVTKYAQRYAYIKDVISRLHAVTKFMLLFDDTFIMRPEYMSEVRWIRIEVNGGTTIHTPRAWSAFASLNISGTPKSYFNKINNVFNKYLAAMLTGFKAVMLEREKPQELTLNGLRFLFALMRSLNVSEIVKAESSVSSNIISNGPYGNINNMYTDLYYSVKPLDAAGHVAQSIAYSTADFLGDPFSKGEEMIKAGIAWGAAVGALSLMLEGAFDEPASKQKLLASLDEHEKQALLSSLKEYINVVKECSEMEMNY